MTMPGRTRWRGWAAAVMLLLAAVGGYALLDEGGERRDSTAPDAGQAGVAPQAVPHPAPVLDRAALIDAAGRAASAHAAGQPMDGIAERLSGRRFRLEMPLGCAGPAGGDAPLDNGWRLDDDGTTLRAAVARQVWTIAADAAQGGSPPVAPQAGIASGDDATAPPPTLTVSGFWISRPWIGTAACPANLTAAPASAETRVAGGDPETLAIVEPYDLSGSGERSRRQAYRADVRIAPGDAPVAGSGLRVRIEGRLAASGVPPVICRSAGPDTRPTCFLIGRFETVAITSVSGDRVHAEWRD